MSISPSVLTLLPTDTTAILTCLPSAPDVLVNWTRTDIPGATVSNELEYQFSFEMEDLILLQEVVFSCSVYDAEAVDVVVSSSATVTLVTGMFHYN